MAREVDAVVLGSPLEVLESRPIPDDDDAVYGLLRLAVERSLGGVLVEDEPGVVNVEFYLSHRAHLSRFTSLPDERVVLFLRNKAIEAELAGSTFYRIVSAQGYLRDVNGATAVPLATEYGWLADLEGAVFDEILGTIADAAAN